MKKLKKFAEEDRLPKERPLSGKFVSSAGALLVALKKEEDIVEKTRCYIENYRLYLNKDITAIFCRVITSFLFVDYFDVYLYSLWEKNYLMCIMIVAV